MSFSQASGNMVMAESVQPQGAWKWLRTPVYSEKLEPVLEPQAVAKIVGIRANFQRVCKTIEIAADASRE